MHAAIEGLQAVSTVIAVSSLYESEPVGGPEQGPYLNAVAVVDTSRTPSGFLRALLAIERARNRVRRERWGPRTLDLDLLIFDRRTVAVDGLTVPHPRLCDRRFVLEPLLEVWPEVTMPDGTPVEPSGDAVYDQVISRLDEPFPAAQRTGE